MHRIFNIIGWVKSKTPEQVKSDHTAECRITVPYFFFSLVLMLLSTTVSVLRRMPAVLRSALDRES